MEGEATVFYAASMSNVSSCVFSDRIFKGVDGKEYKWEMGSTVCEVNQFRFETI